ncbi:MAG TPA: hypothetical protein PLD20_26495 [Blastocatellia bacterium]|nr:hypothetical protein [Blastocatellia bacterium]HMV87222.1 hypothetical protein [Blastocatellia bacterium]HMX29660.1 hypothetical protein [Blastocatellia bacterium]HMY72132.1 hypothetical protein [Blastocatellia bacterium]HMZ21511.1 hypothetical protein [Blastocatellia bacterium]
MQTPETFGLNQEVIDVTMNFDADEWRETGDGLSSGYQHANCLEEVANDGPWSSRYEGSGHNLGLYRDADGHYWECRYNEAHESYKLHHIGKKNDVLALIADFSVRVWDEAMSCEWLVIDDEPHIISSGGIPESVIETATATLIERMRLHPTNLQIVQEYVACEFVSEDEDTSSDEDHTPKCEIKDLR